MSDDNSGSFWDDVYNVAENTFKTWVEYENWDFQRDMQKEQYSRNPLTYYPEGSVSSPPVVSGGGISSNQMLTIGLAGVGLIVALTVLK